MLEPITEDLWRQEHQLRMPGGAWMPVRMTVIRLPGRQLVLHSPLPIDDGVAAELAALGDVAHVIAPSRLHQRFFAAATERYPEARAWPAGSLGDEPPPAWRDAVDQIWIAGAPKVDEVVFHHRASRTLVCTDLVFHVTRPHNLRTRMMLRMTGTGGGRLAASRAWRFLIKDRAAARAAIARLLDWDFDRIVMAHGDIVEHGGRAALADAALSRIADLP
jgi:hypothetical protein